MTDPEPEMQLEQLHRQEARDHAVGRLRTYATDIEYLYNVTRKGNLLHIVAYSTSERDGSWTITRIFSGSLTRMQAQYGLKYM